MRRRPPVSKRDRGSENVTRRKIPALSLALEEGAILARFDTTDTQLRAREALMSVLGDIKYVVAATCLRRLYAALIWRLFTPRSMKLSLDLRGGVLHIDGSGYGYRVR